MSERHIAELRGIPVDELASFLTARSGLPGPRGNLELADAFACIAERSTILRFVKLEDEYLRFCGTEAMGRLMLEDPDDALLCALVRRRAADDLWRVREGVRPGPYRSSVTPTGSGCARSWPTGSRTRTPTYAALPWLRSASRGC